MLDFVLKGDFVQSRNQTELSCTENAYLVCIQGKSQGVFSLLPEAFEHLPLLDHSGKLILCGLVDLHLHAPQYTFRGMGMDLELLDWLNTYTFPEEGKYENMAYAQKAYDIFIEDLQNSPTTRFSAFATVHPESTLYLMEQLEKRGLAGLVGLVSMNRNAPGFLCQEKPLETLESWLLDCQKFQTIQPICTPRFIPSCSQDLLEGIGVLQGKHKLSLQSHLSENLGEIAWVRELVPRAKNYGEAYDLFACFGSQGKTIMAHCVHSNQEEMALMKERGIFVAHCPESNNNLASGIAPISQYLNQGLCVGLGSDIAGGHNLSLFSQMATALQVSKLRWRLVDQNFPPLSVAQVYYLATRGGGAFFGLVGALDQGFDFDVIVLEEPKSTQEISLEQRLERVIYLGGTLIEKYVQGRKIQLGGDCYGNR